MSIFYNVNRNKLRSMIGIMSHITAATLLAFTLAACSSSGESGAEGSEGGNESGESHGSESGSENGGNNNAPFMSNGIQRGNVQTLDLKSNETWAGLLQGVELAATYDVNKDAFVGRLRNETGAAICDVNVDITLDGFDALTQVAGTSTTAGSRVGLAQFGKADFEIPVGGKSFANWTASVSSSGCFSAPGPAMVESEGAEGGTGEGAGESGGEGHGTESGTEGGGVGGESANEASPPIPLTDAFSGVFQNQNFQFAYDPATNVFRGTVENPTAMTICQSRTEVHLGTGSGVLELGPTIPVDLQPGATLNIVMGAGGIALDTYSLHPEASPCP